MRRELDKAELYVLESLIDSVGMQNLMQGVAQIAMEKSEHVQANYADRITAKTWQKMAGAIADFAGKDVLKTY